MGESMKKVHVDSLIKCNKLCRFFLSFFMSMEIINFFFLSSFPSVADSKESTCNTGDLGSISGLGRSPGGGHGYPLQYSCLEYSHGQTSLVGYSPWGPKSWARLND